MSSASLLPLPLILAAAALMGACLGSFANVLIYRLPRNLSVMGPRSFCPACRAQVAWHDNVPVLSWLLLRGRCRQCHAAISWRYPAVEAAGALCLAAGLVRFGANPTGLAAGVFLLLLLVVAVVDWQHMIIPHTVTLSGLAVALAATLADGRTLMDAVLGAAVGAGIVLALAYGYRAVRGVVGMGFGDVMLMGMIGAFVGPWGAVAVLFGGSLLGTVYVLVLQRGRLDGTARLPFGTFLAAAAVLVLMAGEPLFRWYAGLLQTG
ncbi:MAG: prepilin peptidase [Candidatus Krumholzibacteriia bacterium]